MSGPGRARELAAALGRWAARGELEAPDSTDWALTTASELASELMRFEARAEAARIWRLPGRPFVRTHGHCVHTRDCRHIVPVDRDGLNHEPLTRDLAEAYLRQSHDHRRCTVCVPDIPEAPWVRVRSPGGRVRWRLADDVELP